MCFHSQYSCLENFKCRSWATLGRVLGGPYVAHEPDVAKAWFRGSAITTVNQCTYTFIPHLQSFMGPWKCFLDLDVEVHGAKKVLNPLSIV